MVQIINTIMAHIPGIPIEDVLVAFPVQDMDTTIGHHRAIMGVLTTANGLQVPGVVTNTDRRRSPRPHHRADECRRALKMTILTDHQGMIFTRKTQGRRRTRKMVIEICRRQRVTPAHLGHRSGAGNSALLSRARRLPHQLPSRSLIWPKGCRLGNRHLALLSPLGIGQADRRRHILSRSVLVHGIEIETEIEAGNVTGAATGVMIGIEVEAGGISEKDEEVSVSPGAGVTGEKTVGLIGVVTDDGAIDGRIYDLRDLESVSLNRARSRQSPGSQRQNHRRNSRRS